MVKNLPPNAEDVGSAGLIPELGRSPLAGNGNPLQYSCLENPTDRGAWQTIVHGITESDMITEVTELNQSEVLNTLKKPNASYNSSKTANTDSALATRQETRIWSLGHEDPFEKGIATHSSILVWRIPRTEEPGGIQSMGSQRVRRD